MCVRSITFGAVTGAELESKQRERVVILAIVAQISSCSEGIFGRLVDFEGIHSSWLASALLRQKKGDVALQSLTKT